MQSRNAANLKGIDIASYQTGLNFALVKEAGIDTVYIKATEGVRYARSAAKSLVLDEILRFAQDDTQVVSGCTGT